MNTTTLKISIILSGLAILLLVNICVAQNAENTQPKRGNFGYSQNPKTKTKKEPETQNTPANSIENQTVNVSDKVPAIENDSPQTNETIAQKTLEVVKKANRAALVPTENYKVGSGDILFINLQNSSKGSTFFTVLNDGTIDYPLAGEMLSVAGLTTDEIEDTLRDKIKLYKDPQVSVKVREYSSHKITVLGLVEKSGEKFIQREAIPLFAVRAEAIVQPKANHVIVRRADSKVEEFDLRVENNENILIFPSDIVEFTNTESETVKNDGANFYYIGGGIISGGQKEFHTGLTLTQAILASGGLRRESIKKVVIRRKNSEGLLVSTEYNLRLIKDGKNPDPSLEIGDTIEIGN